MLWSDANKRVCLLRIIAHRYVQYEQDHGEQTCQGTDGGPSPRARVAAKVHRHRPLPPPSPEGGGFCACRREVSAGDELDPAGAHERVRESHVKGRATD